MTANTGTSVARRTRLRHATGAPRTSLWTGRQQGVVLASGDELVAGQRAGEYVVQETLAAGGCGTVYRARHRVLGRLAALKVLHRELLSSDVMRTRFLREARAMSALRHPAVADVYDLGTLADGRPYYVMELLDGMDLDTHLRVHARLGVGEVLAVLEPVCDALGAAHAAGLVHRDVKASNVFLVANTRPGASHVKLLDFGVAKPTSDAAGLTSASVRIGTPAAMAPEQVRGEPVDARTDVYALGVLLFHALTGELPFDAEDAHELKWMHLEATPPAASARAPVPPAIDRLIQHAMAKRPEDRIPTARAFVAELRAAAAPGATARDVTRIGTAVAIFVEATFADGADVEPDDELLDTIADVLDRAACRMAGAGYARVLETGCALLCARVLTDGGPRPPQEAMDLARDLAHLARPRVQLHVEVRTDRAVLRGHAIIGGPIARLARASTHPVEHDATVAAHNQRP